MRYQFLKGKIKQEVAWQGKEIRAKTCFIKLDNGKVGGQEWVCHPLVSVAHCLRNSPHVVLFTPSLQGGAIRLHF